MKRLKKMLGLAVLAALAMAAFVGASADAEHLTGGLAIGFTVMSATVIGTAVSRIGKTSGNDLDRSHTSEADNTATGTVTAAETVASQSIAELDEQLSNPSYERVTANIIPVMAC